MRKIKFMLRRGEEDAYEWDYKIEEVPDAGLKGHDEWEAIRQWGRKNLPGRPGYEGVNYIGIQSMNPREKRK